jgi:hypothetical protein
MGIRKTQLASAASAAEANNMTASYDLISKFSKAIAVAEGYGKPGPTAHANNPGNITDEGDVGCGCIETGGPNGAKITIYPTALAGWAALENKISRIFRGASHVYSLNMTIAEFAIKWCGDANWGINVAQCLQVSTNTTLASLVSSDPKSQESKWPNG